MTISYTILLSMRNVSGKSCRENQNTHFMFSNTFYKKPFHNVEINCTARQATDDNIIWRMCIACWITKATDTHSEYVILIAILQQQWLRECTSMLYYTYTTCLVIPLFLRLMTSSGELGWDYETDKLVFHTLFLWSRSPSGQSSCLSFKTVNCYCDLHNDTPSPPHSISFLLSYASKKCLYLLKIKFYTFYAEAILSFYYWYLKISSNQQAFYTDADMSLAQPWKETSYSDQDLQHYTKTYGVQTTGLYCCCLYAISPSIVL